MKIYSAHGINDFVMCCCGYKGHLIKEYFATYFLHRSDVTLDLRNNKIEAHQNHVEPWKVTLAETGETGVESGELGNISTESRSA